MVLYTTAKNVVQKIIQNGYIAYFAGGFVRDKLLSHPSDDIDIATNAPTSEILKIFPKTVPVGVNYGIVIVVEDGHQFEVATFRKERGYKDGRRPDHVERASPQEDAQRRDFTINGMFFDPISEKFFDYVNGKDDLKKKIIRAIGDPHERFLEDRLRMIRAIRYAARFHFSIDEATIEAIKAHSQDLFPAVAIERIVQELKKMSIFANFPNALVSLHKFGLLQEIFPSLISTSAEEIKERVKHLPNFPKTAPLIAKILELFPKASLKDKISLCKYLKLSNEDKKFVERLHEFECGGEKDDYDWLKLYATSNTEIWLEIAALHSQNKEFKKLHLEKMGSLTNEIIRQKNGETVVSSAHLLKRGVKPGVKMGSFLKEADRIAVNLRLENPDEVLKLLSL